MRKEITDTLIKVYLVTINKLIVKGQFYYHNISPKYNND